DPRHLPSVVLAVLITLVALFLTLVLMSRMHFRPQSRPQEPRISEQDAESWTIVDLRDYLEKRGVTVTISSCNNPTRPDLSGFPPSLYLSRRTSLITREIDERIQAGQPIPGVLYIVKRPTPEEAKEEACRRGQGCWAWGCFVFQGDPTLLG